MHFPIAFSFFINDTATTEIYTLSLHDALPISQIRKLQSLLPRKFSGVTSTIAIACETILPQPNQSRKTSRQSRSCSDRKSTRLNSSHVEISYAVFCLKKKKKKTTTIH